jgi:hypothetical protein
MMATSTREALPVGNLPDIGTCRIPLDRERVNRRASARHRSGYSPRRTCLRATCHRDWRSGRAPARCGWLRRHGCRPRKWSGEALARARDGGGGDLLADLHTRGKAFGHKEFDQNLAAVIDAGDLALAGDIVAGIDGENAERPADRRGHRAPGQFEFGLPQGHFGGIKRSRLIGLHTGGGAAGDQAFSRSTLAWASSTVSLARSTASSSSRRIQADEHIAPVDLAARAYRNVVNLAGDQRAHRNRANRLTGADRGEPVVDDALADRRDDNHRLPPAAGRPEAPAPGALADALPTIRSGRKQRYPLKSVADQDIMSTGIEPRPPTKATASRTRRRRVVSKASKS